MTRRAKPPLNRYTVNGGDLRKTIHAATVADAAGRFLIKHGYDFHGPVGIIFVFEGDVPEGEPFPEDSYVFTIEHAREEAARIVDAQAAEVRPQRRASSTDDPVPSESPIPENVHRALRRILGYLWTDEAAHCLETSPLEGRDEHIFHSLVEVRDWLDEMLLLKR